MIALFADHHVAKLFLAFCNFLVHIPASVSQIAVHLDSRLMVYKNTDKVGAYGFFLGILIVLSGELLQGMYC